MDLVTRPATPADVPALVALMAEFHSEAGFPLDPAEAAASFAALLSDPTRGAVWIVHEGGVPAGHAVLTVRFSMEHGGLDAFIDDLFVRPAHRRRGAGRELLAALFAGCRERAVRAVHVEVGRGNAAAQALYADHGLRRRPDDRELLTVRLGPGAAK